MSRWFILAVFGPAIAFTTLGCATIFNLKESATQPYSGTAAELDYIANGSGMVPDPIIQPIACLDLPFTIAADTLLLPISLAHVAYRALDVWNGRYLERLRANPPASPPEQAEPECSPQRD